MVYLRHAHILPLVLPGIVAVMIGLLASSGCRRAEDQAADVRLKEAIEEVGYFGFQRAGELFESVAADSEPGTERWQQAIFGQATCLQQMSPIRQDRLDRAAELYRQLIGRTPDSIYAARATLNLGRMAELSDYYGDDPQLESAREYYRKIIDRWRDDPIAGEATLRLAATYIQTYDEALVRQGIGILESWLAEHPDEPLAVMMYQYLGDSYFIPLKDYASSLKWYRKADVPDTLDRSRLAAMYWRMAAMADEKLNDRETAVEYYTKLIKVAPTGHRAYPSVIALRRLGAPVPEIDFLKAEAAATAAAAGDFDDDDDREVSSR